MVGDLRAVSLFSGAGGLDLGVESAGFSVTGAVEWNNDAALTLEKNLHEFEASVLREDIRQVSTSRLLRSCGFGKGERPDLLIGGPPCVAFSKSGFWLEWKRAGQDRNAGLLAAYTRVLAEAQPRAFLFENVYALVYRNAASRPWFERLLCEISKAGYKFEWKVLNAADYGVPQLRPRLFLIGVRDGERVPCFPEPTHSGPWERRPVEDLGNPHVTTGQALRDLPTESESQEHVNGKWGSLLPEVPPGENYLHFTAKKGHPSPLFEWRSRYWNFLLKIDPQKPSPTIQAQPGPYVGPFHWENRRLRVPELRRLFTFPDDFEFVGTRNSIQRQVGNSVPPLLARQVAERLYEALMD